MSQSERPQLETGQCVILPEDTAEFVRNSRNRKQFPETPKTVTLKFHDDGEVELIRSKNAGGYILFVPEHLPLGRKLLIIWSNSCCAQTQRLDDEVYIH